MLLKRVDGDEKLEVELSKGSIEIGRGPLLKCNDKRVSRNHAVLEVSDVSEKVIVTATHTNPCFYQKKGKNGLKVLHKDQSVELSVGDQLQLLPTIYTYELLPDQTQEATTNGQASSQGEPKVEEKEVEKGVAKSEEDKNTGKIDEVVEQEKPEEEEVRVEELPVKPAEEGAVNANTTGGESDGENKSTDETEQEKSRKIPAWMLDKGNAQAHSSSEKRAVAKRKERPVSKSPPKSPSETAPAPKKGLGDKVALRGEVNSEGAQATRPACQYGSSCYRRNPAHKDAFSHPGDDDFVEARAPEPDIPDEDDPRPECEYGLTCYRKNPRHREAFKHTQMPRPTRAAKKRGEHRRREEDYEKDEEDKYDLEDPFLNDEDDDTSDYIPSDDDEDDDWNVKEGDDSEVVELLKEARDFMRNKKMQEPP